MLWPSIKSPLPMFPNACFSPHLVLLQSPLGGFLKNKKTEAWQQTLLSLIFDISNQKSCYNQLLLHLANFLILD